MQKAIWLIFSFLVTTILFQNCSGFHAAPGDYGSEPSVFEVADSELPVITMATPNPGDNVSGSFIASANATDNIAVVGVQFYVDGNIYGSEVMTSPYFVNINSLTFANGSHSITAKARDAAGNFTTSSALSIMVNNVAPVDTLAPSVSITSPSSATTVSGTVNVTASATDAVGVVGVQFFIDGVALGAEDLTSPYGTTMNAALYTNGSHSITAKARDAAGNNATSMAVTITVNNPAPAPTYSWIASNILTPKCVSCHGASGASAGRGFNSYTRTMTSVKAGSATTSILYTTVTTGKMSKSPYPILSTTDRNAIRDWINAGALNN